jgi:hypothetical protein
MSTYRVTIVGTRVNVEAKVVASYAATTSGWSAKVVKCAESGYVGVTGTCRASQQGALTSLVTALHLAGASSVQAFRPSEPESGSASAMVTPTLSSAALGSTGAWLRLTEGIRPTLPNIHSAIAAQHVASTHLSHFSHIDNLLAQSNGFHDITRSVRTINQMFADCGQKMLAPMSAANAMMEAQQTQFRKLFNLIDSRMAPIRTIEATMSSLRLRTEAMASFQYPSVALQASLIALVDAASGSRNNVMVRQTCLRPIGEAAKFVETTLEEIQEEPEDSAFARAAETGIEAAAFQATASSDVLISIISEDIYTEQIAPNDLFVRPAWNLYDVLGAELREASPVPDEASPELRLAAIPSVNYMMLASTVCHLVTRVNSAAALSSRDPVFTVTERLLDCIMKIPLTLATDEREFAEFVDALYQVLWEGSGRNKRIMLYLSDVESTALKQINDLRNWFRHDLGHGDPGPVRKKHVNIGRVFAGLILRYQPLTSSDYRQAQYRLLARTAAMLQCLLSKISKCESDC